MTGTSDETGNARPGGLRPKPNGNGQTAHRNQEVFIKSIYTNNDSDNHRIRKRLTFRSDVLSSEFRTSVLAF